MLAAAATDLHVVLVGDALESVPVLHELGQVDVDRGAEGGAEVGGAGGDVAQVLVVGEASDGLNLGGGGGESGEDLSDVGALLHGDDTELVLLVDPDEEGLVVVVEDTSALWPVAVEAASFEEAVTLPIKFKSRAN